MNKNTFLYTAIFCIFTIVIFYSGYIYGRLKTNPPLFNNNETKETVTKLSYIHPIDIEEEKCIADSNVYEYSICIENAEKAWETEIQKNLELLKNSMLDNEYKFIIEMNTEWNKSLNKEINVINRFITNRDGIIHQTTGNSHISNLKKEYAILLKTIYTNHYEECKN